MKVPAVKGFVVFIFSLFLTSSSGAACDGFLPENSMQIPITNKKSGLSESEYHAVIDKVEKIYISVSKEHGALLKISRKWEDATVNAGTFQDERGKHWHINLYGGLARHSSMTQDGFALVICHELGHHIGGAPKKFINEMIHWASTEGQSDYFATLKCLRKVFAQDDNGNAIKDHEVPQIVKDKCAPLFPTLGEVNLCIRTSMAGLSVAEVMASGRRSPRPRFESPDLSVLGVTMDKHPPVQCRLDTYFQGSLCKVSSKISVSQKNESIGTCHSPLEFMQGLRPACWYKFTDLDRYGERTSTSQ